MGCMTLRKIAWLGHPVLLGKAAPVEDVADPGLQLLIDDMLETMADAEGIGLAAPQVYAARRVILAQEMQDRSEAASAAVRVLINPELEPLGEEPDRGGVVEGPADRRGHDRPDHAHVRHGRPRVRPVRRREVIEPRADARQNGGR